MRRYTVLFSAILFFAASLLTVAVSADAQDSVPTENSTFSDLRIEGNQRIEPDTIRSYLAMSAGSTVTRYDMDRALKDLYATGFFADVKLFFSGSTLVVKVVENPIINRIVFEGNDKMNDEDLEKELELKPRAIYTRTKVQNDVKRILDIYRRSGRFSASVEPKAITLDQNRIDLVFEINEGPVSRVEKIFFLGNKNFSDSDLRKVARTEETRWYKFFSDDDKYDPDRLLYDQELLRRYYTSQGYADFQVKSAIAELTPEKDAFYLTFTIDEGKKYNFGDVKIDSTVKGAEAPDFTALLKTKTGETYNGDAVEGSIDAMIKELGNRGFAFVDIQPQLKRNPDADVIDLTYNIKEGPRVYVERINITGNVRTLDEVVRREFRVAEGDPYNTSKLSRSEQRLNNLGFFEKVTLSNEQGTAPDKTIINVDVAEKSTGEITLGAGFSTADGPLADFGISEKNFLGRGQDMRVRAVLASKREQYQFSFTEPYFLNRELAAGFDVFKTTQDFSRESSFDRDTNGFTLRAGYLLSEKLQHNVNYSLQTTDINNIDSSASRFIKDQAGKNVSSAIGHNLIYDNRNNKFDPTDGYYVKISQDFAGLGGDSKYLRHELKGGYYFPVAPRWTLKVLGSSGYIFGLDEDVRINDRFFVGGTDLRGFETAGIGPRDKITEDALGGNTYYAGTVEMTFPLGLPEELGFLGAVFMDAGSLWSVDSTGPEVVDDSAPRASAGIGVAWASPFGPIRIDFAQAFVKEDIDQTEIFRFSFGTRF